MATRGWKEKHDMTWIVRYYYQWFVTLTFPRLTLENVMRTARSTTDSGTFSVGVVQAEKMFIDWRRSMEREERIQVAGVLCIPRMYTDVHIHALMVGRADYGARSLNSVDREKWEARWKWDAQIDEVYEVSGVARYLAHHHNWAKSDETYIQPFNAPLLRRYARPQIEDEQ